MADAFPCPACGFLVFDEPPGSYGICPVCGWEDDHVQLRHPLMGGGANSGSLYEQQQKNLKTLPVTEAAHGEYVRDPGWRPLTKADCGEGEDAPRGGREYFEAAGAAEPGYYWRKTR